MRRTFSTVLTTGVVLAGVLGSAPLVVAAQPIKITSCPFTIATSDHYSLKTDCTIGTGGIGITIVASNAKLTMAGHTLTGPGDGTGTGILITSVSNVIITGGTVKGFGNGVELDGVSSSRINGLVATNNVAAAPHGNGVWLHSSSANVLVGITASGNRSGFRVENESNNNTLTLDSALSNIGNGFLVRADAIHSTSGNMLLNNVATGNVNGIAIGGAAGTGSVTNNTVQGNQTSGNSTGINVSTVAGSNVVSTNTSNNSVVVNGTGGNSIVVAGPSNTLQGNITNGNAGTGIWLMSTATSTTVTGNTTSSNGFYGMDVSSTDNSIVSNTADTDHFNGVILRAGATGNTVESNTALGAVAGPDLYDDNAMPTGGSCPNTWLNNTFDSAKVGGAGASCIH